jgi:hypothetical protein
MEDPPSEPYYWCSAVVQPRRQTLIADPRYQYLTGQRLIFMCGGHIGDPEPVFDLPPGLTLPPLPPNPLEGMYAGELSYSLMGGLPKELRGLFYADLLSVAKGDLVAFKPYRPPFNQEALAHTLLLPYYIFAKPEMAKSVFWSLGQRLFTTWAPWGPAHEK